MDGALTDSSAIAGAFDHMVVARADEIDPHGHANNVAYLAWLQQAAIAHSTALGWPPAAYRERQLGWVVRRHAIDYFVPVLLGETLTVRTWVSGMEKARSTRDYEVLRQADGMLLAAARTEWVLFDFAANRPARMPADMRLAFTVRPVTARLRRAAGFATSEGSTP